MSSNNDERLYRRLLEHDQEALEAIYDRYSKLLYSFAYKMTNNEAAAEEVVQDVLMKIWHQKAVYDSDKGKFSSWILTVTRFTAIDHVRREKQTESLSYEERDSLAGKDESVPDQVLWKDERKKLLAQLHKLNEEQRKIIDLFYFKGLSQRKIAEACNMPLGTVKSRIRLALKHLKTNLTAEREGDI